MIKIGIGLNGVSYSPEAYAYRKFLVDRGYFVQLALVNEVDPNNDLNIFFMGIKPFWKRKLGRAVEIHEYQSLSTPPYSRVKDILKGVISKSPNGRIFLNDDVKDNFYFIQKKESINRDMGVDEGLFQKKSLKPEYDIIYSGSISGRVGVVEELSRLACIGFKLLVIGDVTSQVKNDIKRLGSVHFTGRVSREELPSLYNKAKAGLNYTPDIYPFNIQTSTKSLEYLASGLTLISNKYGWSEKFVATHNIPVIWTDNITNVESFNQHIDTAKDVDMSEYNWESVLKKSRFEEFISNSLKNK